MARYKDSDWKLPSPQVQNWEQAGIAVLMDIRDELKLINQTLRCSEFQSIPRRLKRISANTYERKRKAT